MNFKGLTDWFEIFRTGTWTDAAGNTRDWTKDDLDTIAANYDPATAEAPLVIGHPAVEDPAWGWVDGVKRVGEVLYAKAKDVVSEFEDLVKQGMYKKRSVRLSPDGTKLLHVGFLGAAAPAVGGLKNIGFSANEGAVDIEFADIRPWTFETIARIFRSIRDWLIEKEGKDTADAIIPDWDVEYIKDEARAGEESFGMAARHELADTSQGGAAFNTKPKEGIMPIKDSIKHLLTSLGIDMSKVPDDALPEDISTKSFSEAEVKAREKAAADKAAAEAAQTAKEDAKKEFAEQQKQSRIEQRKGEIKNYCEQLKKEGRLLPAWEKLGLQEFMLNLDGEEVIEFAAETKVSRFDWFKGFMEELPKVINFSEIATRDTNVGGGSAGEKLEKLVKEKMEKNDKLNYSQAFSLVQKEHPDLVTEYQGEMTEVK